MNKYLECIKCGGELEYQKPHTVLTTYPPQIALICKECGHMEYKRIEQLTAEQVEKIEHEKLLQRVEELEKKVAKLLGEEENGND